MAFSALRWVHLVFYNTIKLLPHSLINTMRVSFIVLRNISEIQLVHPLCMNCTHFPPSIWAKSLLLQFIEVFFLSFICFVWMYTRSEILIYLWSTRYNCVSGETTPPTILQFYQLKLSMLQNKILSLWLLNSICRHLSKLVPIKYNKMPLVEVCLSLKALNDLLFWSVSPTGLVMLV